MADLDGGNDWRCHVRPAQQGDRDARALLYRAFAKTVHAIALAHVGFDQADDVTQDVFCTVFATLNRLREPEAFAGFLCTAARNAARDQLRRQKREPAALPTTELTASEPSPAVQIAERETTERVLAGLQSLPEAFRETLMMRLVSGLSGQEIAERTGLTHGSVRVNLTRGMAMLRERLGTCLSEDAR